MKKSRIIVAVLGVIVLLLCLVSCDFSSTAKTSDEQGTSYYFENKNGDLNRQKWIAFFDESWMYYDGSAGAYTESNNVCTLQKDGAVWASGTFLQGKFILNKDGKSVIYYSSDSQLPQVKNALSIQSVYDEAVDLGFEGTLEELIDMFHGKDGESAYELAVRKGYHGTEAQWIASLAGSDGITPIIGENGNWMVGEVDTGVKAAGTGIVRMEKTATVGQVDTYTFFMSDGQEYSFTIRNGLDGAAADKGIGIEKIEKTATNGQTDTYTITYTDGNTFSYFVVNGRDGIDGRDGVDGVDGIDGRDAPALTAEDFYQTAVEKGYQGTYLEFLAEYLPQTASDERAKVSASAFSTVSIICVYDYLFQGITLSTTSSGSGSIYQMNKEAGDAYIITNYHVVYASNKVNDEGEEESGICDKILVYLFGSEIVGNEFYTNIDYPGMYMEAEYIGGSMNYDIALLKVTGSDVLKNSNAKPITFADSNAVSIGDTVYAVGNGGGDGLAMTKGIINHTSENLTMTGADGFTEVSLRVMRYDAAVNPGNSGCPLFDTDGNVIGVVNAKMVDAKYDNVGYAIPSNLAKNVIENILYYYEQTGETPVEVKKLLFGLSYTNSKSYAEYDESTGKIIFRDNLHVASVNDTSLVYGQIEAGDDITKVTLIRDNESTEYELTRAYILADLTLVIRAGDVVELTYERVVGDERITGVATVEVTAEKLVVAK